MPILGVDCGDVIFYTWRWTSVPGALNALRDIVSSKKFGAVYVISKVNPISRIIFLARLQYLDFWRHTGIPRENLYFCRRHEDKAPICARLGVTHFIDDRLDVLHHMKTVPYRYAFGPIRKNELKKHPDSAQHGITFIRSWGAWDVSGTNLKLPR